ncbi:MAG: rRNA maturation RNase YbeY [Caldilinea sp.]
MDEPVAAHAISIEIDEDVIGEIDAPAIRAAVAATLHLLDIAKATLTVVLTTDEYVRSLNAQYRGIDASTDVLSFAARESLQDAPALMLPDEVASDVGDFLGDLVIAYPYSVRQAANYGNSVTAELQLLAVHGTLHLLGYDHDDEASEQAMWSLQEQVLAQFGLAALARRTYDG